MLPFLTPPVRFSFALSILLKFSDPEGCEAFNFRQKGHVNGMCSASPERRCDGKWETFLRRG